MPGCPEGHRTVAPDWCDVCGRPLDSGDPGACRVCSAPLAGRFCDECGADDALPVPIARIAPDPEWFAHVRRRAGGGVGDRRPPSTPPWRVRLEHRQVVLGRRRRGRAAPDVDLDGDDGVSARHAVLVSDGGGWSVVDLGSRNGTAVGSFATVEPHRPVPVPPGAVVRLGLWTSVLIEPG